MLELRSDIDPELDELFATWCDHHHRELVALPGVRRARRYLRTDGRNGVGRYLTVYDLESVAVLETPAFLDHATSGTPMPPALGPSLVYGRTVAHLIGEAGDDDPGGPVVRARFDPAPGEEGASLAARLLGAGPGAAAAVRVFQPVADPTAELVVQVAYRSAPNLGAIADPGLADAVAYRLVFEATTATDPG
jgi:hypothetical protein